MSPTSCRCSTPRLPILGTDPPRVKRGDPTGRSPCPDGARTKVPADVARTAGLPGRTTRRTLPDMFRRQRTVPSRDISSVAIAFHGRLAGMLAAPPPNRPVLDRPDARNRLAAPASAGLRERLARRVTA